MGKFEKIKNDKEIIETYKKISEYETINKGWAHHDYQHAINVVNMVEKLLTDLGYDKEFIEEAKIAAILHDTGCTEGKENHEIKGYEFAKQYIEKNKIELKNKDMVLNAIKLHREGFETDNIIALALIISDKLDIKYTRVTKEGSKIEGMKEYLHIKDIQVEIKEGILKVNFVCDNKINKKSVEEFYFTKKYLNQLILLQKRWTLNHVYYLIMKNGKYKKI